MLTVVVIEEDAGMQMLIREWLDTAGYHVGSGASEWGADVDLVIIDIPHLRFQGAQTVREARASYPRAAMIGISTQLGHSLSGNTVLAVALRVGRLMSKPLGRDELLAAVVDAIGPAN